MRKNTVYVFIAILVLPLLGFFYLVTKDDSGQVNSVSEQNIAAPALSGDPIEVDVLGFGFEPSQITIPAGEDVVLKTENAGASGCMSSLISNSLFNGSIQMGQDGDTQETVIKADKPGDYTITCWMGMGVLNVKAI